MPFLCVVGEMKIFQEEESGCSLHHSFLFLDLFILAFLFFFSLHPSLGPKILTLAYCFSQSPPSPVASGHACPLEGDRQMGGNGSLTFPLFPNPIFSLVVA
jgi:hypothetical protein